LKKICWLFLLLAGFLINATAQCSADPNCPFASLICASTASTACVNVAFSQVLTLAVPVSITSGTTTYPIQKIKVNSINGLPPGISYQCNPANCTINGGARGCILISGTASTPGTYQTQTNATVTIVVAGTCPFCFTTNIDTALAGTFVVQPKDCAGVCGGTAAVDNCGICSGGTTGILPNCADTDACTQDICNGVGGCTYTNICNVTISGKIQTEDNKSVPGVTVNLNGSQTQSMNTASDGLYSFTVNAGGNYTVTPSKVNDLTTNIGVTTVDISLIRRHVLGSTLLNSPYKIIAADGSNSGTVSTGDIPPVRIVVLSNTAKFPPLNSRLWEFVSSYNMATSPFTIVTTKTYNNLTTNQLNQDFIGVKVGDVNNSWTPGTP